MVSAPVLGNAIAFVLFAGGFGLLGIDYYYDTNILDTFEKQGYSALIGLAGFLGLVIIGRQHWKNLYFIELTWYHGLGFFILVSLGLAYAYSQGWLDRWLS